MSIAESSGLVSALRQLMPEAMLSVSDERPWHSITFAGAQIRVLADIAGKQHRPTAAYLIKCVPEHQFDLGNVLVADIAVTDYVNGNTASRLVIDILLLDD